ncbi:MAG: transketolase C-terminal domain-containing protein [Candidatus Acidiferrales bacterium]
MVQKALKPFFFDAKGLLKAAIRDNNPVLFLEYKIFYRWKPESLSPELRLTVPEEDYVVPIGKARVVKEGKCFSVIAYGSQVLRAVEAVRRVESEDGVSIELIDLRSLVPYASNCIQRSAHKISYAAASMPWIYRWYADRRSPGDFTPTPWED